MRFCTYVIRKYKDENSDKGALARSIKNDSLFFPSTRISYRVVRKYLENFNASKKCLEAFDECWKEWQEYEGKIH